jgi:hypothetical protein
MNGGDGFQYNNKDIDNNKNGHRDIEPLACAMVAIFFDDRKYILFHRLSSGNTNTPEVTDNPIILTNLCNCRLIVYG